MPVQVVRRARAPAAAARARGRPALARVVVHEALERLYREPPGDDSIPRPGDVDRWRERFAELLDEAATERRGRSTTPGERRSNALAPRSTPSSSPRRGRDRVPPPSRPPRGRLRPVRRRRRERGARTRRSRSATSRCGAGSTASTSPRRAERVVHDYKTGKSVSGRTSSPTGARSRSSSTCGSPSACSGSTPVGRALPPAGRGRRREAKAARASRPRGRGPHRARGRRHRPPARRKSSSGRSTTPSARRSTRRRDALRADRPAPDRRQVPEVLHLPADLPARARRRRRRRRERQRGRELSPPGDSSRSPGSSRPKPNSSARADARRGGAATGARRVRTNRRAAGGGRGPRARQLPARPAPAPVRPACWSTATARRSPRTASRSIASSPSRSPSAPRTRCGRGFGASSSTARGRPAIRCAPTSCAAPRGPPSEPG